MAGRYTSLPLAIPRATRATGRYVSLPLGPAVSVPISVSPTTLTTPGYGVAYSATLSASGGATPYTWDLASGALPTGLSLSSSGVITGTTSTPGVYGFTVRASDATPSGLGGPYAGVRVYSLTIVAPPWRGRQAEYGMRWTRQLVAQQPIAASWNQIAPHSTEIAAGWARSAIVDRLLSARWAQTPARESSAALSWAQQSAMQQTLAAGWSDRIALDAEAKLPWSMHTPASASIHSPFASPPRQFADYVAPWAMHTPASASIGALFNSPPYHHAGVLLPWEQGYAAPWRIRPPDDDIPPPPPPPPQSGRHVSLRLACPRRTGEARYLSLPIGPWQCYVGRLKPKVITVQDSVVIVRVPDSAPISATSVTVRADLASALWSVQLRIADAASLDLLRPGVDGSPRKIRVTINGHAWVFLVEQFAEQMRFGAMERTADGRSAPAVLTGDYATARTRTQTSARTAQQLADEELDGTGYTVDWHGPDWLVPGGVWSYANLAPMDALKSIAEACGCVLQSHPTDPVIAVVPAFSARPWLWASTAPDADIVDDYVLQRTIGSAQGTRHNAVEVRGELVGGIRGEVKITGSAGDIALPQVSHPLITAVAAAEARGIYELASVGPIGRVGIELPLFGPTTAPGLVLPGTLARLSGELMTRSLSVQIAATWSDGAGLYVRQSLELERHYDA